MSSPFFEEVREIPSGRWERDPDRSWRPVQPPPGLVRERRGWTRPNVGTNVVDFGSGFDGPRYFKGADGVVHLRGGVGFTGTVSAGATVLTLPAGFRPGATFAFPAISSSGAVRLEVAPSGIVSVNGTSFTTGGFLSLSGIYFHAEA